MELDPCIPLERARDVAEPWVVDAVTLGLPALVVTFVVALAVRELARARRAAARAVTDARGRDGGRVALRGRVLGAAGARPVMAASQRLGARMDDWMASADDPTCRVVASPFELELASGERVRVEPGERPEVVGPCFVGVAQAPAWCSTWLLTGRDVVVEGELRRDADPSGAAGGYRDAPAALALVAPAGGAVRVFVERPEVRHAQRARYLGLAALALALLAAAANATPLVADFRALHARGVVVRAAVAGHDAGELSWGHGGGTRGDEGVFHVAARWVAPGGARHTLRGAISASCYVELAAGRRRDVTFVVLPSRPSVHEVGPRPTVSPDAVGGFALTLLAAAAALLARLLARSLRPSPHALRG